MAYNNTIPKATDQIKNSQADILGNFVALSSFGNGYCDLPVQGTQPPTLPLANSTDDALYTFLNPTTGKNELYVHKQIFDAPTYTQIPMTASCMSNTTVASCVNGWSYLPSGLLMKWGMANITTSLTYVTINADSISGGPNFTQVFQIMTTAVNKAAATADFSVVVTPGYGTGVGFTAYASNANANTALTYLVIGV